MTISKQVLKDNQESGNVSGRNNNNMAISSRLVITEPPKATDSSKSNGDTASEAVVNIEEKITNNNLTSTEEAAVDLHLDDKGLLFLPQSIKVVENYLFISFEFLIF